MCDTPLFSRLTALADEKPLRFCMPGHGGMTLPHTPPLFDQSLDFTELAETGNLYEGDGAIAQSEALWARRLGAQNALYLTGGSSQGLRAMLLLFNLFGKKILLDRNLHTAAQTALALCDCRPVYVINPTPDRVCEALVRHKDIAALLVTSPTYYGKDLPLAALAQLCRAHAIPLLVDEAHGAHYPLLKGKKNAVAQGAQAAVTSLHKTLPAMGQTALLTLDKSIDLRRARQASAAFGTASPSYVMMAAADRVGAWLDRRGADNGAAPLALRQRLIPLGAVQNDDPYRLYVQTVRMGFCGRAAKAFLRKRDILIEMADKDGVLLILSPLHTDGDFCRLFSAFSAMQAQNLPEIELSSPTPPILPRQALTPRAAFAADKTAVPLQDAVGRVAGQCLAPFPPGVPLVMPGEIIEKSLMETLFSFFSSQQTIFVIY